MPNPYQPSSLDDEASETSPPGSERALYYVLRTVIAVSGLLWVVVTFLSRFVAPELLSDRMSAPPIRDRLIGFIPHLGFGLLLMVPYSWTLRRGLYWVRQFIYLLLGVFLIWVAGQGILTDVAGGSSWKTIPAAMIFGSIGIALPLCLWWSQRIHRIT